MHNTEQVKKWVRSKFEKIINKDLKTTIIHEDSAFDAEAYVNNLLEKYFSEDDVKNLKEILISNAYNDVLFFESENSTEERNSTCDSLESVADEYQSFSAEEIIKNLESDSEEIVKKSLKVLGVFVEEVINQSFWSKITDLLQKSLSKTGDRELMHLVLKIFQKSLGCSKKPQIVCKGFTTIVNIIIIQIDLYNLKQENTFFEEVYDLKKGEWLYEKKCVKFRAPENQKSVNPEALIKLMWLLIDCQQQIPVKWVRFNETKFREIIFSFVRLLCYTNTSEEKKITGLELLSVLNPTASWCRYWCHTAVGRSLLCSALRKYKNFFIQIIEIILNHVKNKKTSQLPSARDRIKKKNSPRLGDDVSTPFNKNKEENKKYSKQEMLEKTNINSTLCKPNNFSTNVTLKKSSLDWIIKSIPRKVVTEAVFFHCVSFICCLIQFRSGRALFPVQTVTRKRLLSAQDLSLFIIEYLENIEFYEMDNLEIIFTTYHKTKALEMLEILKKVKAHITSSRMSAERQQFSYL